MKIDMHNHVIAPSAVERLRANPEYYGARMNETPRGVDFVFADGSPGANLFNVKLFSSLEGSKAHLERIGATGAVLSTSIGHHRYGVPIEQAVRHFRNLNDGLAEWIRGEPMLKGMAALPLQEGRAAADELARCTSELGLRGAMVSTNLGDGRNLDDPGLEPLWEMAQALDAPVFLHPTNIAGRDRLGAYGLGVSIGNPFDSTIAAAALIFSGVLDRYPNLKIVLSHGGGYFPMAVGRLTHAYEHNRQAAVVAQQPPEAYLRRFYYDTILFHAATLVDLIHLVGADRLMLGTDYPHEMEPPEAVKAIEALDIAAEESKQILGNAATLYGFEEA